MLCNQPVQFGGGEGALPEMRLDIQTLCLPNQSPAGKEKKPKHFCFDFLI